LGSAAGQTNGAVAGTVEVAAAAAAADHYMGGTAAMVVAEADLGWGPDFLGSSEDSYFEIGSAVTSASESRQAHWRHSEIAGAAEKIEKNISIKPWLHPGCNPKTLEVQRLNSLISNPTLEPHQLRTNAHITVFETCKYTY